MNTRSILILTAILVFGVLVTMGLVSQSTSDTKAAEGATGLAAKRTKRARDTQSKPPTVDVKKRDSQPAAGEKDESSEIREIRKALSALLALKEGVGSNQQIQEKKAVLKAAIESGMKKDPKSVLKLLFGFTQVDNAVYGPNETDVTMAFIQRAPELAIALLDQVPNEFGLRILAESIGKSWAASDLKAAFAWANQQTDSKIKDEILEGVISSWAKTDLQGAFAYAQSLPPGDSQDSMISKVFENTLMNRDDGTPDDDKLQGALAMIKSLPEGRTKDLATKGISEFMAVNNPHTAYDIASGIGDSDLRMRAEEKVLLYLKFWSRNDLRAPAAATQWMQSLPVGQTKDMLSETISREMAARDPQAAMDIATGIGDSKRRAEAQENVVNQWSEKNPAAATEWMQSLPKGLTRDLAASGISQSMAENDPQAAMDMATGIGDTGMRTRAEAIAATYLYEKDPAAAIQWMQSLPVGQTKDSAALGIISMNKVPPAAAMEMASGIGDSNWRTEALKATAAEWLLKDPAAATQWINRSTLPQEVKTQLLPR